MQSHTSTGVLACQHVSGCGEGGSALLQGLGALLEPCGPLETHCQKAIFKALVGSRHGRAVSQTWAL